MKIKKNENRIRIILLYLLTSGSVSAIAKDIKIGEALDIPYSVTYPSQNRDTGYWSPYYDNPSTRPTAGLITIELTPYIQCDKYDRNLYGWSSDKKIFGFKFDEDDIIGVEGTSTTNRITLSDNAKKYNYGPGGWISSFNSDTLTYTGNMVTSGNSRPFCGAINTGTRTLFYIDEIKGAMQSGTLRLYIGPNATPGKKTISAVYAQVAPQTGEYNIKISDQMEINVIRPRNCTVSTDNTITFPPVDVSDAKNNQALANKTGNLTVNCDDDSNAPVTVEIQGTKGRYTDAMALTMKDGSDAPAEVRGFIGKDIPLTGQCNGRLDGYPGIVYFIPNAGLEKMTLTPGANKYNWVLCSKGQNKTGQATGSAKLILNWD